MLGIFGVRIALSNARGWTAPLRDCFVKKLSCDCCKKPLDGKRTMPYSSFIATNHGDKHENQIAVGGQP
jgi:hypothetical protein